MSKATSSFVCTNCDYKAFKWQGCCPDCQEWNSIVERTISPASKVSAKVGTVTLKCLRDIPTQINNRMVSGVNEWDRVLGSGIMPGSFLILTGDPGIGKSTLLLQIAHNLAEKYSVIYFSSEESLGQVKQRAERLLKKDQPVLFSDEGNLEKIIATTAQEKPDLVIIDSIQNCYFSEIQVTPGSIGQLRESGFRLMRLAKENNIAVIVTGHITKEGQIAGPKTLEHMVDGVFYLQGEDRWQTRILRSVKNRFGPINEIGFFDMGQNGLTQVPNISQLLLQESSGTPGLSIISSLEGSRPLLLEVQALTVPSKFGIPQRIITGADHKHVMIIVGILEKYLQVKFSAHDIFFKVSGGFKIKDSSADLGIALALLSSFFQQPLPEKSIALAEIHLTGQIKPINHIGIHTDEAKKFGAQHLLLAQRQKLNSSLTKHTFSNVYELLKLFDNKN
ncbi:DNA repair protein RadA [candidate division TM6 bacterium RIFCSPHIGHO2_12_FULL_36_22]|nr:MAG: DNA repair protein RadA [candidate division TM6 bacterium RIFCSPHIGHO2_12_FULL_36_22]